jgi:formylglycine-generating enzyme required for sulfatase activity/C1A family cysteine protease
MKRILLFATVIALAFSLFTCATQGSLKDGSRKRIDLSGSGYRTGTVFDRTRYDSVAEISKQGSSTRGTIPPSFSMKVYAPIPGQQGNLGSCFAWASAYAARTIIESQNLNRTDKILTTKMAFSPIFLYFAVREFVNAPDDSDGASLIDTVQVMASTGLPRRITFDESFVADMLQAEQQRPFSNPIMGFGILFTSNAGHAYRIDRVKRSLLDGDPVIIALEVTDSFKKARDVWIPKTGEDGEGGHAICVVGYDDAKYGGAFEVMNSWGEEWGNGGYTWISYATFGEKVVQAWVINDDVSAYNNGLVLIGKADVEIAGKNGTAQVQLMEDGIYRLPATVKNGSPVKLNIVDTSPSRGINTYMFYVNPENGRTARVNGNDWITTDKNAKAANFVILYSRSQLDINSLLTSFGRQSGSISSRLSNILGKNFTPFGNAKYEHSSMEISASLLDNSSVAGMVLTVNFDADEKPISDMIRIKGGTFVMGSPSSEQGRDDDERQKNETLGDYYIGAAKITVKEFRDFVNATGYKTSAEKKGKSLMINFGIEEERNGFSWQNPGFTQEDSHPVVHINWYDALEYCNWRSRQEGFTPVYRVSGTYVAVNNGANGYRLPTEAEWEYACRAGTATPFNTGGTISPNQANFGNALLYKTTPVRKYAPNQWGLYDTHGNVLEWCSDMLQNDMRSVRGGTWLSSWAGIRSAYRSFIKADVSMTLIGFRLVRNAG